MMFSKKIIYGCEGRGDFLSPYLTRYTIIDIPDRLQICIHVFHRSDAEDMHDHPWPFISVMLWRGYLEHTPKGKHRKWPGMVIIRKPEHRHRVELVKGRRAVTLVIMGKRSREWGFFTKSGWINWKKYFFEKGC